MGFKKGNDDVRGDSTSLPDRGTSTGLSDTYGADVGVDAINRQGSMSGTGSQSAMDNCVPNPQNGKC